MCLQCFFSIKGKCFTWITFYTLPTRNEPSMKNQTVSNMFNAAHIFARNVLQQKTLLFFAVFFFMYLDNCTCDFQCAHFQDFLYLGSINMFCTGENYQYFSRPMCMDWKCAAYIYLEKKENCQCCITLSTFCTPAVYNVPNIWMF